jgi:hypothetical protein
MSVGSHQGYRDAPDPTHVYAVFVGTETDKAFFENNDAMWLGRVPRGKLLDRSAWTFYAGMDDSALQPTWTTDDTIAVSIFRHPLMTAMQQVTYNVGLKRHVMAVWSWVDPDGNPRGQLTSSNTEGPPHPRAGDVSTAPNKDGHDRTQLTLWEAEQPWGPWKYFHRDDDWRGPDGSSGGYTPVLPPAWISEDGISMWMVFTQCCPGELTAPRCSQCRQCSRSIHYLTDFDLMLPLSPLGSIYTIGHFNGPPNNYNFTYQQLNLTLAK